MCLKIAKSCFVVIFALTVLPQPVDAVSRRTQQENDALLARMTRAEEAYRSATIGVQNDESQASANADNALEDMEDVIIACAKARHCPMGTLLTSYKRLLKTHIDTLASDDSEQVPKSDGLQIDPSQAQGGTPERRVALFDPQQSHPSLKVTYNAAVQIAIRRWLTELRPQLFTSYENYMNVRSVMWPEWQRRELPESLLFGIIAKESTGRSHINSRTGAVGLMQFMPATGRRFGLGYDETGFDSRLDAQRVAAASALFLSERLAELNGNIELSLAGYNGGEGRAARIFTQSRGGDFWDAPVYAQFPPETQDYVPMVIAAALLFLHPAHYGVEFPQVRSQATELTLQRATSLYELAVCLGNKDTRDGYFRALRNLNPRYEPDRWIPSGTRIYATQQMFTLYRRYCLSGPRAQIAYALATANIKTAVIGATAQTGAAAHFKPPLAGAWLTSHQSTSAQLHHRHPVHVVTDGQTLRSIAERHRCAFSHLAQRNHIAPPLYRIHPGQTLTLQGCNR